MSGKSPLHRVAMALAALLSLLAQALPAAAQPIVVASKIDTEGALLGNMIAEVLEARGMPVERKIQLGPTNIVRAALLAGQIDIYPEYTGNGALFFHREADPAWKDAAAGYAAVKQLDAAANGLVWLDPGAGQQHLGDRGPRRPGRVLPSGKCLGDLAALSRQGRPVQARRLGGVRRKRGGAARRSKDLRVSSLRSTSC